MAGRWWTDEEVARLLDMAEDKALPWPYVARELNRTVLGVRNKFWAVGGLRPIKGAWSRKEQVRLIELAKAGCSASEIGRELDRTKNSIIGRCHTTGVQLNGIPGGRPGSRRKKVFKEASVQTPDNPTLIELKETQCHWPINNGKPFRYCGKPVTEDGTQYCSGHEAMKWQPRSPGKRRITAYGNWVSRRVVVA